MARRTATAKAAEIVEVKAPGVMWAAQVKQQMADAKAAKKAKLTLVKVEKGPRLCACGCGGMTKGGAFLPGHDSQLLSAFINVARGNAKIEGAPAEVKELYAMWRIEVQKNGGKMTETHLKNLVH